MTSTRNVAPTRMLTLTKHHGLGNDFIVLADQAIAAVMSGGERAALARAVCDRHRGVGADGLLFALPAPTDGSADVTMRLHNADGGIAEMSGNGIRCFAQAIVDAGIVAPGAIRVATDAGLRTVDGRASNTSGLAHFRVDMGSPATGPVIPESASDAANVIAPNHVTTVDVGNPHIVVAVDHARFGDVDIATFGPSVERAFLDGPTRGINVEVIALRPAADTSVKERPVIDMLVWERGVGVTQACGTGAVASAIAAHRWGLIDIVADVVQPGGTAGVEVHMDRAFLIGPTQFICTVVWPWNGGDR
jgi:diaminopimelate epimerase